MQHASSLRIASIRLSQWSHRHLSNPHLDKDQTMQVYMVDSATTNLERQVNCPKLQIPKIQPNLVTDVEARHSFSIQADVAVKQWYHLISTEEVAKLRLWILSKPKKSSNREPILPRQPNSNSNNSSARRRLKNSQMAHSRCRTDHQVPRTRKPRHS